MKDQNRPPFLPQELPQESTLVGLAVLCVAEAAVVVAADVGDAVVVAATSEPVAEVDIAPKARPVVQRESSEHYRS